MRFHRYTSVLAGLTATLFCSAQSSAQPSVGDFSTFELVSSHRVSRFTTQFEYRALVVNGNRAVENVSTIVSSTSADTTIVDPDLSFDPLTPLGTGVSLDTFVFEHDRRVPFDPSVLQFQIGFTFVNAKPVADAGLDQTVFVTDIVALNGTQSSDLDGDTLTFSWTLTQIPAGSGALLSDALSIMPSFLADLPGTYMVQLIVNDGSEDSDPDFVAISTENSPPLANAGPDQTVFVTDTVGLDGSGSMDVDGDSLSYSWTLTSLPPGSSASLSNSSSLMPDFVVDLPGTYVAELIVNDGSANSVPDEVRIDTENSAPVANAGADQTVSVNDTATLDGSGSTDVDGDLLSFSWSLVTIPAGSSAALSSATEIMPSFTADRPGTYVAQLIVDDGALVSTPDTVTIDTANSPPLADAGPDQTVFVTDLVTLDGSGSSDVDGDLLSLGWSFVAVPPGSTAALSNPGATMPSFIVDQPGTYVVQLIVNDGVVDSLPDTISVATENSSPIADAGPNQTTFVADTVALDGSASSDVDNDPLTFDWALTAMPAGSTAVLNDATTITPNFVADLPGTYMAQLIVNDGVVDSVPDTIIAVTENSPPIAHAGFNQVVAFDRTVTLDGSLSRDIDGDPLTYQWSLTTVPVGSAAVLSDATVIDPTFVGDAAGVFVAELIVNDGQLDSTPHTVRITVEPAPTITAFSRTIGGGLQFESSARLEVANHGGVFVHIVTSDETVALVAPNGLTPGAPTIDVWVPDGSNSVPYAVQGIFGTVGTATVTASATGFTDGVGTVDVVEPAVGFTALADAQSVGTNDGFLVLTGVPDDQRTRLASLQRTSAANQPALRLTVSSSDETVAEVSFGGNSAGTITFDLQPNQFRWDLVFVPLDDGATTVSVSIPGFLGVGADSLDITVAEPGISLLLRDVGAGLQFASDATLDVPSDGAVVVRVESSNPAVALIAPDSLTAGTSFIDVTVPAGSSSAPYVVQGVAGSMGAVTVTASAAGFTDGVAAIDIVQPAVALTALSNPITVGVNDGFNVLTGTANGTGTGLDSLQRVSAANVPGLDLSLSSSDGTVAALTFGAVTADSILVPLVPNGFSTLIFFNALAPGTTRLTVTVPGFLTTTSANVDVIVNPP